MPPCRYTYTRSFQGIGVRQRAASTSTSACLQRTFRAPDLLRQIEATPAVRFRVPGLLRQIEATCLQRTSIPLRGNTPTVHLQTSFEATSSGLQHTSRASYIYACTSTRFDCKCPELLRQTPPRLHTCIAPPELHTSMSLRLQRTSRAPELLRQIPPCLHACSPPPYLLTTTPTTFPHSSIPLHPIYAPNTSIPQVRLGYGATKEFETYICISGQAIVHGSILQDPCLQRIAVPAPRQHHIKYFSF